MQICAKLKQYYKYLRNWKKLQSRQFIINRDKHLDKELNFYSQLVKRNNLCFDIGANIGDKTDLLVRLGAVVVAVEPQESCWRVLKRRFKNNNVFMEPIVLDNKNGSRTIFIDKSHILATISQDWITTVKQSGRFSSHKWTYQLSVKTTSLDALIKKYDSPAFCKIDVEGAEFEVLQGLSQPIDLISIEFVSERIDASIKCIDYLSDLGKTEFNYCIGGSTSFALPNWVDSYKIKSILTTMNNDIRNYGDLYIRSMAE